MKNLSEVLKQVQDDTLTNYKYFGLDLKNILYFAFYILHFEMKGVYYGLGPTLERGSSTSPRLPSN